MDRLDQAVSDFEDENSETSLSERISNLRHALMWESFSQLKNSISGKVTPDSEQKEIRHVTCMKYFFDIEKLYLSDIKANKVLGKTTESLDSDFLERIKGQKGGALSEVVQVLT